MIKMNFRYQNCFYLAFLQIVMPQIHVFWMLPSNTYWLLKDLTSFSYLLLSHLINSHFSSHMLTLLSPTIVLIRFNDNWLFVSFFYYCHYYFSLVIFYLVLFFIRWLYNDLLNFSFCKYISSHSTSICSKLVLLPGEVYIYIYIYKI